MSSTAFLLWPFLVPHVAAVLMPGWRSLGLCAVLIAVAFLLGLPPGDGPAGALGMVVLVMFGYGAASGIAARAITLGLGARWTIPPGWRQYGAATLHAACVAVAIGFFVLPASAICRASNAGVILGGRGYALAPSSLIAITEEGRPGRFRRLGDAAGYGLYCRLVASGSGPVPVSELRLSFSELRWPARSAQRSRACPADAPSWLRDLCEGSMPAGFPRQVSLFAPGRGRLGLSDADTLAERSDGSTLLLRFARGTDMAAVRDGTVEQVEALLGRMIVPPAIAPPPSTR